ncbi:MAG TPA: formate/nitrite transporter family protein [Selenomonadales bacterium]|nr:formate/nitrite transporter family protein [Selenomonadales bacterium]
MNYCTPREIVQNALQTGVGKSRLPVPDMLALGALAGAYIAFAAEGSTMAVHDVASVGFGRFLAGVIFATGLMLVVICGAELFTGNALLWLGFLEKKVSPALLLRNWWWVYLGNLLGSILLAGMMDASGLWSYNHFLHGGYVLKLAVAKVNLSFSEAFFRGILCNWLVCLALWMAYAAKDIAGKIWGIFFPIMLFITSAFEHSVANMYYLSDGLLAKACPPLVAASGVAAQADALTVQAALIKNLLPVTLGNIVVGALFIGSCYWYCYRERPGADLDSRCPAGEIGENR